MTTRSPRATRQRSRAPLAVVAIAAILMLAACGGDSAAGGAKLSEYDGKGFIVSYPASWKPYPHGKIMPGAVFEVVDPAEVGNSPKASIHADLTQDPGTLLDTVNGFVANLKISNSKLLKRKKVDVDGGEEGYIVRQKYSLSNETFKIRQVDLLTLTSAGKTLDVRLICRADMCNRYDETFDAVLDSVRITSSQ